MKIARRKFDVQVPNVGMGDIAFNLLIFFVILAKAQDDSHVQWKPANTPKVEAVAHARVSVAIDVDYKFYVNGKETSEGQLPGTIEKILGDAPQGERVVFLKVTSDAPASKFEPALAAISEAGGEIVHILKEKKDP